MRGVSRAVLVIAAVLIFVSSALAAKVPLPYEQSGVLNEATFKVRVPANWNGTLLVYAHGYGYLERLDPAEAFNMSYADAAPQGVAMEESLLSQGYALAGSTFGSVPGWQVKEGIRDTISLISYFKGQVGKPDRVIVIGYSMGSVIALNIAEEHGKAVDGVIAGCTIAAGTSLLWDYVGALSLAYDTAFGWPAAWGTWAVSKSDVNFFAEVLPVLATQISDPANFGKFEFIRLFTNMPVEDFYYGSQGLFKDMFFATQGRAEMQARAGGPVSAVNTHLYAMHPQAKGYLATLGVNADAYLAAMNNKTTVTVKNSVARYREKYSDFSGNLQVPVISMHNTIDAMVPAYYEPVLLSLAQKQGKNGNLVQIYSDSPGHCNFQPTELLEAVQAMEDWLDTGVRPERSSFIGFNPTFQPGPLPIGTKPQSQLPSRCDGC